MKKRKTGSIDDFQITHEQLRKIELVDKVVYVILRVVVVLLIIVGFCFIYSTGALYFKQ